MKLKVFNKLAFILKLVLIFIGTQSKAFADNTDTIQFILNKKEMLNIDYYQFIEHKSKIDKPKYDTNLEVMINKMTGYDIGIDSNSRKMVFFRYFLDKAKYFDSIIRYLNSISDYEILSEEPEFYIWKNKEDRYFVLQITKDTCIFTELVLGYFLKYYAKYLE
jgi:hypothetical protein